MGLFYGSAGIASTRIFSKEPVTCRLRSEFFALSTAIFAVRKCASVSDRTEEKHFFEKNFSNDILYMTKIIVMKGGVKHEVNEPH